jgi:hypothetical protein
MATLETTYSIGKIRLSQRASTFLVCLIVSILLWISQALSRDYTTRISLPLEYVNLPNDKVLAEPLPTQISVEVKTSGFDLMKFGLKHPIHPIVIDAHRFN